MMREVMEVLRSMVAFYFEHITELERWRTDKEFIKDDKRFLATTFIESLEAFARTDSASEYMKASDAMATLERRYWNKELGH